MANSGSFLSEMTVTSQTLIGMSERGLLPKKLLKESRYGTYPYALGVIAVLIAVSQPLDFHALVLVCECAARFVQMRLFVLSAAGNGMVRFGCLAWCVIRLRVFAGMCRCLCHGSVLVLSFLFYRFYAPHCVFLFLIQPPPSPIVATRPLRKVTSSTPSRPG